MMHGFMGGQFDARALAALARARSDPCVKFLAEALRSKMIIALARTSEAKCDVRIVAASRPNKRLARSATLALLAEESMKTLQKWNRDPHGRAGRDGATKTTRSC